MDAVGRMVAICGVDQRWSAFTRYLLTLLGFQGRGDTHVLCDVIPLRGHELWELVLQEHVVDWGQTRASPVCGEREHVVDWLGGQTAFIQ